MMSQPHSGHPKLLLTQPKESSPLLTQASHSPPAPLQTCAQMGGQPAQPAGGRQPLLWGALAFSALCAGALLLSFAAGSHGVHRIPVRSGGGAVRVALLSDPHIAGPQYSLGGESNELDNLSIIKTQQRLWQTVAAGVRAMAPPPDLALFLGDIVHNGLDYSTDYARLTGEPINGFHIAASLLKQLGTETMFCFGNHDVKVTCGSASQSADRELSHRLFRHFLGAEPYAAADVGAWRVVTLNSMLGHTWTWDHTECNIRLSSYGAEQLRWLEGQLAAGRPTLVALHFPLPTSVREGDTSIVQILAAHPNVKLVLSGHFHKGFDWQGLYPFPHLTLPAVRYDASNFFLLELHEDGTHSLLDWEKNRGGARCSDAWTYDGAPSFAHNRSAGDCGVPLAADTAAYELPEIKSTADIPRDFNPEKSCAFGLAQAFLEPCAREGATAGCCGLLATQFAPTSSWPFASCLCQPAFWKRTEELFWAAGRDAAALVDECVASSGQLVLRRGAGACPGPPQA